MICIDRKVIASHLIIVEILLKKNYELFINKFIERIR